MKLSHAEFTFEDGTVVTFSAERGNDAACCLVSLPGTDKAKVIVNPCQRRSPTAKQYKPCVTHCLDLIKIAKKGK